jgi:hypothetical protein
MSETPDSDGCPPCPHGRILEAYKEILPELTQPRIWRTNQQAALRARWREKWKEGRFKDEDGGGDYFKRFFSFIRESSFLMGKVSGRDGRSFKATLQWFVTASHFDDIVGRKYHD